MENFRSNYSFLYLNFYVFRGEMGETKDSELSEKITRILLCSPVGRTYVTERVSQKVSAKCSFLHVNPTDVCARNHRNRISLLI